MRWPATICLVTTLTGFGVSGEPVVAEEFSNAECLDCHTANLDELPADVRASMVEPVAHESEDSTDRLLRRELSLTVDSKAYEASVHGAQSCTSCHQDIGELPHRQKLARVACETCHPEAGSFYRNSAHAQASNGGRIEAATCQDCHGSHDILPVEDRASRVYPTNLPKTCASCHADTDFPRRREMRYVRPFEAYAKSIHFKALKESGLIISATCNNCHGGHSVKSSEDSTSTIFRTNVPRTCAQCHLGIYQEYKESIHGKAALAGIVDSPVCTDCHGEHDIEAPEEPTSTVYSSTISKTTCPRCHAAERLARKYGLSSLQVQSYQDSFHGLADQFGETTVANCASCHGIHDILPSSDTASTIHPDNLPTTCGSCHPGAGPNFARGAIHVRSDTKQEPILYYARFFYIFLIVATISGMTLHNGLDYAKKMREHYEATRSEVRYMRFTVNERIQHALLLGSFFVLVITGFALKFPEAFWVKPFIFFKLGFLTRGYAHRVAAVVFTLLCLYHVYYLSLTARGREQLRAMIPGKKDLQDLIHQVRYFLGYEEHRAKFQRFSYVEKGEYVALVWGSNIMILTGIILWFEVWALEWMPKWCWDLAEIVHYYEAWLATLAVLVWHFYHVMFNPVSHGVSLAMVTGELTEEDMELEHSMELEDIRRERDRDG